MNNEITVRELANLSLYEDLPCQIWTPLRGTVFDGSFEEAKDGDYADIIVDSFQVEDDVFVINV